MKALIGQTDLRRFAIMGEETWAGVSGRVRSTISANPIFRLKESSYVTSSQQYSR